MSQLTPKVPDPTGTPTLPGSPPPGPLGTCPLGSCSPTPRRPRGLSLPRRWCVSSTHVFTIS